MEKCIKCSGSLPPGALYCPYCGKKQTATERKQRKRGNGEGSVFRYRSGWRAQIVVGYKLVGGKSRAVCRTKAGFKTKKEAIDYLAIMRAEKPRTAPTLHQLWEQYQEGKYRKLSASRQEKYRIAWPKLRDIQFCAIDMLTTADLQRVVNENAKTFYPARDMRDLLSLLFQIAMADQYVQVNLAEYIDLPVLEEKEQDAFTPKEITALWTDYAAGNWWTGYVLLMIYTGMMPGELMAMRKDAVDIDKHAIIGGGIKTEVRKKKPIILADEILPVITDLMERTPGEKVIRINKDNFYDRYYETLSRAGVRRLVPYTCRHTAATVLADAAVQPSVIQAIMRHASYTTTQRYIHEDISRELAAANAAAGTISKNPEAAGT